MAPAIRVAPRWRVLWSLTAVVLLVHLWLLTDALPVWPGGGPAGASGDRIRFEESTTQSDASVTELPPTDSAPTPALRSTVRWIELRPPPPPPPPEPARQARARIEPAAAAPQTSPTDDPKPQEATAADVPPQWDAWIDPYEAGLTDTKPIAQDAPSTDLLVDASAPDTQEDLILEPPTSTRKPASGEPESTQTAPSVPTAGGDGAQPTLLASGSGPRGEAPDLGGTATLTNVELGAHVPPSTELRYAVTGNIKGLQYSASAMLSWRNDGQRYDARSEIRAFLLGSRSQTSVGRIGPTGIEPERFADRRRQERAAHFDRDQQRIRFSSNAPDAPLKPGSQDQLTASLQLATLLRGVPAARAAGHVLRLPVSSTSYAEVWRFEVGELVSLELPAGATMAHKITRGPRREFDKTIEIWLAPIHGYLPVRMRITEHNGDAVDQQLAQWPEGSISQSPP